MYVNFDDKSYPKIYVELKGQLLNNEDYLQIPERWESYYMFPRKEKFTFIFNLLEYDASFLDIIYATQLVGFINKVKKERLENSNYDKLEHSIIIVDNTITRYLLKIMFSFQLPLAPIYVVEKEEKAEELYNNFINHRPNDFTDVSIINI